MKQFFSNYFYLAFCLIFATSISAQTSDKLWNKKMTSELSSLSKIERRSIPTAYEVYNLDINELKHQLQDSPKRKGKSVKSSTILSFPTANGILEKYEVFEASILNEELQKKYPAIKSYIGRNIENPSSVVRFSISKIGLHAMIMQSKEGSVYIDPYTTNKESYIIYSKKDVPKSESFECMVEEISAGQKQGLVNLAAKSKNANDGLLRTFRLAIATTGEYSQFQLVYNGVSANASIEEKKETVLAAINATMTRVNAIFEKDVALTMELVANNSAIIFLDPDADPFTNNDGTILIDESQTAIDTAIGFENYDIGHTFCTGGGGLAQLRSPCTTSKARGVTGSSFPIGDTYDIDFVAHEMGHQFGANHTFNSDEGNCAGGNRNDSTAIESGSGSTIMAYAGLCAPDNVQSQSDDYFHLVSINEMWNNITTGNSLCGVETATGNLPPKVEALISYTLPISTPFVLKATATDDVGDELTYTWEQLDNEIAESPPLAISTEGASFRSIAPSTSPMRYFPGLNTVLAGHLSTLWEVLPSVGRTMKFGVNVRDNNLNGGQTASREMTLTFDASSGPFKVTSQNVFTSWDAESNETVTWDVANTNNALVNCSEVNILLSTDGGLTFPIVLALNVSNNGSASIVVPNITTTNGRIKIESANNVFYDINESQIIIQAKEFSLNFVNSFSEVCKPTSATYNFAYNTYLGFNEITTFSASGNPAGTTVTFNPSTATSSGTSVEMTISGMENAIIGTYEIFVKGISDVSLMEKQEPVSLAVFDASITSPTLISPVNNEAELFEPYVLEWNEDENVDSYEVQIATDNSFNTIVEQSNVATISSYSPQLLSINTVYYWRVKAINNCGGSSFSSSFSFTTADEICDIYSASTPHPPGLSIPDNDANGIVSTINVIDNKLISNVNVEVKITHPYVSDLAISLISPSGITILLSVNNGGTGSNYANTIFDDSATVNISDGSPPFSGTYIPQIPFTYVNNTESQGLWSLKVVDSGEADTGTIDSWSIEVCGIPTASRDDDGDGVINGNDQCPDTPLGTTVNEIGCFALVSNNFEVKATSETCPNTDNGTITVSAIEAYTYNTVINGISYSFSNTSDLLVENLPPGIYDFCVTVEGEDDYEQCFTAVIEEGIIVSGKASVASNKVSIDILEGTPPFNIRLNGKIILNTSAQTFSIDVKHGDVVEVRTAIDCESLFLENIDLLDEIIVYPNPTNGLVEIAIPMAKKRILIEIYNVQSQLISSKIYLVNSGKVQLNLESISTGVYLVRILTDNPVVLKIIKL